MDSCVLKWVQPGTIELADWRVCEEMNDLDSLLHAVTAKAYAVADQGGRLPERIGVSAKFDLAPFGGFTLNQSRNGPGLINVRTELAPQAAPAGLQLLADYAAKEAVKGQKKNTRKRTNHAVLYRRQVGYCAGCGCHFQSRNLTIDHVVPKWRGGSDDISNFQLLCDACNQMKGDGTQEELLAELRARGYLHPALYASVG